MKRENWYKSEKQVDNARLCNNAWLFTKHFVAGAKSDDPLHKDYVLTVFALSLWLVPLGKENVLIKMKDFKNMLETRMKKKKEKTLPRRMKQQFM